MVARTCPRVVGERLVQTCWGRRGGRSGCSQQEPDSWSWNGSDSWCGRGVAAVDRVPMRLLLARVYPRRHHSQERFETCHRKTAGRGREQGRAREARGSDRNDPFNAWIEPYDTDASKPLFCRNPNQREGEAVQRVCGISHLYHIGRKCSELERGSLMYSFSLNSDSGCGGGRRPARLATGSLQLPHDIGSGAVPAHWHTRLEPLAALQSAPATGDGDDAQCPWSGSRGAERDRTGSPGG